MFDLKTRYNIEIEDTYTKFAHTLKHNKVNPQQVDWYVEYFPKLPVLRKLEGMYDTGNLRFEQFANKLKRYYRKLSVVYPVGAKC